MPRPGPRRPNVTVRLDPDHAQWLAAEATRRATSQGAVVRELIAHAITGPPTHKAEAAASS